MTMEKKAYMRPEAKVEAMELEQMIAISGGGNSTGDPVVDPVGDDSDDDNRARIYNDWDDADW